MPFYDVWEKKAVFLVPATPPDRPTMPPWVPGWEPGDELPGIWPGPHPEHPIMLPGMPGWGTPLPPDEKPPTEPPAVDILPDLNSPGFWTWVVYPNYQRPGFIQTSLNTGEDHEPKPPKRGTPGEWIAVYNTIVGHTYAWLPKLMDPDRPAHSRPRKKHT
jgi:hypothetical protein